MTDLSQNLRFLGRTPDLTERTRANHSAVTFGFFDAGTVKYQVLTAPIMKMADSVLGRCVS